MEKRRSFSRRVAGLVLAVSLVSLLGIVRHSSGFTTASQRADVVATVTSQPSGTSPAANTASNPPFREKDDVGADESLQDEALHQRWVDELLAVFRDWGANSTQARRVEGEESRDECDEGTAVEDCAFCRHMRSIVWARFVESPPHLRKTSSAGYVSASLQRALRRQLAMHRAVEDGRPMPGQKYVVWSLSGGLGNRFQSLASTFVLALVSRRVLLLKDWFMPLPPNSKHNVPIVFPNSRTDEYPLEPLQKLFWDGGKGGNTGLETGPRSPLEALMCPLLPMMSLTRFRRKYPSEFGAAKGHGAVAPSSLDHVKVDISARHDKSLRRWNRFLCSDTALGADVASSSDFKPSFATKRKGAVSMTTFFDEKFVYVWTNQYYLPGLFANPAHADELHDMFPNQPSMQVYNLLVKLLVIPSRPVMATVASFAAANVELDVGRHVSLQIRAFQVHVMDHMARGFDECLGMLRRSNESKIVSRSFFLASMHPPVRAFLIKAHGSGVVKSLAPASSEQGTGRGPRLDQEALADMVLLAMSRHVFISPGSTFGSFIGAFGDILPRMTRWYLHGDVGRHTLESMCPLVASTQPCFAAWFKYDHLFHRSSVGSNASNELSCGLRAIPSHAMHCSP